METRHSLRRARRVRRERVAGVALGAVHKLWTDVRAWVWEHVVAGGFVAYVSWSRRRGGGRGCRVGVWIPEQPLGQVQVRPRQAVVTHRRDGGGGDGRPERSTRTDQPVERPDDHGGGAA